MQRNVDICVLGALDPEVDGLLADMKNEETVELGWMKLHVGEIEGKTVCVTKCGMGKVSAAIAVQSMVDYCHPKLIVNTGIAGALAHDLRPGSIVIAESLVEHDVDTSPIGDPIGFVSGVDKTWFDTDAHAREILLRSAEKLGYHARIGKIATGDQFVATAERKKWIVDTFGADACEMEGCATAQAAYMNGVPCIVIRAISDAADGSAEVDYFTFKFEAAAQSAALTKALIRDY